MTARIFIDGEAGTTGLQIRARLTGRRDVELLSLPDSQRKDPAARARMLNGADLVILCLPDDAAREAVSLIDTPTVKVLDASTAHRTASGWVYGLPELAPGQDARIAAATRVSNPGCYPTGAVLLLRPLIDAGLLPADHPVTINAVSGYSGGGRRMIEAYEKTGAEASAFQVYGLGLEHKHVAEIQTHGGLTQRPLFMPSVGRFHQGMIVQIPLQLRAVPGTPGSDDLRAALRDRYRDHPFLSVADAAETEALTGLDAEALNGTNDIRLYVLGNDARRQAVLVAVLDNLGKGASGAAVQNLNLMLGLAASAGLSARLVA
ncbi:MAG: N-acetyl-gamma-glutamyl-phosphate reductase [Inquilinaceae bacterium]